MDAVGGIDITLDEQEVKYLNSTNYISDTSNHTLTVGKNHMNGNQALGFARVRYVMRDGECGDFARTLRHRTVMTALYRQVNTGTGCYDTEDPADAYDQYQKRRSGQLYCDGSTGAGSEQKDLYAQCSCGGRV